MQNSEINLPDWLEIDFENSSKHTIVMKKVNLKLPNNNGFTEYGYSVKPENYVSLKAAKSAEAKRILGILMRNFNGTWIPNWENPYEQKHCIYRNKNTIMTTTCYSEYRFLAFVNPESRDAFLSRYERLIKDYFEMD